MTKQARDFWDWVDAERRRLRLSWRALERAGGVSNARFSAGFTNGYTPTLETCRAIAEALRVPLDMVLRRAGMMPEGHLSPDRAEIDGYLDMLNAGHLAMVRSIVRALALEQVLMSTAAERRETAETDARQAEGEARGETILPSRPHSREELLRLLAGLPEERLLALLEAAGLREEPGDAPAAGGA